MTPKRALVVGFGVTGEAVAAALVRRGGDVVVADDAPAPDRSQASNQLGLELVEHPSERRLRELVAWADAVMPSPGVGDRHPVFAIASELGVPVNSEFDLAGAWDRRPVLAVTGTDGKTTVTTLVTAMLEASGTAAATAGNTAVPLVAAIDDPRPRVLVVEASSFRLAHSRHFRPAVATWLNFAPDHLDAHRSVEAYEEAKARLWDDQEPEDIAVAAADDPVVMRHAEHRRGSGRLVTFGPGGDYRLEGSELVGPQGPFAVIADMQRTLPHDIANALAAGATALEGGATPAGVAAALRRFEGLPHRLEFVGELDGVRYYDDSKSTAPHATLAAISGFDSVVLIAGGRNKGLDLSVLVAEAPRLRAVVAIGESSALVRRVFEGSVPVAEERSMAKAVERARYLAREGDAVLLSPACASFDWYSSYADRGDDFVVGVRSMQEDSR